MRSMVVKYCLSVVTVLFVAACAATQKTAEWRDPSYAGQKFDDILVIGVANKGTMRRLFESNLVDELTKRQVAAIPSFSIMAEDQKISEDTIKKAIKGKDIDAVLVTHLVGVEQREVYQPPRYSPGFGYYGYYSNVYTRIYEPGYYQRYQVVKLETTLYDVETEKPVWSMQSDTIDPEADEKLIKSAIDAVIKALTEQALI